MLRNARHTRSGVKGISRRRRRVASKMAQAMTGLSFADHPGRTISVVSRSAWLRGVYDVIAMQMVDDYCQVGVRWRAIGEVSQK